MVENEHSVSVRREEDEAMVIEYIRSLIADDRDEWESLEERRRESAGVRPVQAWRDDGHHHALPG